MMRMLQTSSVIFQKNNRTVTLTRQDFLTDRGYRAGFDVYVTLNLCLETGNEHIKIVLYKVPTTFSVKCLFQGANVA